MSPGLCFSVSWKISFILKPNERTSDSSYRFTITYVYMNIHSGLTSYLKENGQKRESTPMWVMAKTLNRKKQVLWIPTCSLSDRCWPLLNWDDSSMTTEVWEIYLQSHVFCVAGWKLSSQSVQSILLVSLFSLHCSHRTPHAIKRNKKYCHPPVCW